jgi:hypothetical protein
MGRVNLSSAQFYDLENKAAHSKYIKSFKKTGDFTGDIDTQDVAVSYVYNSATEVLNFEIGHRHSLAAKAAPAQVIENHIAQTLHELEPAPVIPEVQEIPVPVSTEPDPSA